MDRALLMLKMGQNGMATIYMQRAIQLMEEERTRQAELQLEALAALAAFVEPANLITNVVNAMFQEIENTIRGIIDAFKRVPGQDDFGLA